MKTQGSNILHAIQYMKRKKGSNGLSILSKNLSFKIEDIKNESWHPFEWYIQVLENISLQINKTGYSIPARIGYNMSQNIGFLKNRSEKKTPSWVLGEIKKHWNLYYDFGRVEIVPKNEKMIEFHLFDYESNSMFCEKMNGFLKGLLREVCLEKDAIIEEIECHNKDGTGCIFQISW